MYVCVCVYMYVQYINVYNIYMCIYIHTKTHTYRVRGRQIYFLELANLILEIKVQNLQNRPIDLEI